MDDQNKAENDTAEVENSPDTTPVAEPEATEEVTQEAEASASEVTETAEEPKKGFEARVKELNTKAKTAEEKAALAEAKAQSLEAKIAALTGSVDPQVGVNPLPAYNPQEPIIAPGEEIDVAELNKRQSARETNILKQADAMAQMRAKQSEAIIKINSETSEVLRTYPELDPDSDSFNKDLSDAVTESVENAVKASPYTVSVKSIAAKLMKPYQRAVTQEVGKATENIAKQASAAALKPISIRKEEKTTQEKSIAELEKELGVVQA